MLIHSAYELALLIRNRRKQLKLTQKEMSELVGLQQKTISAMENNPENARITTLLRVLSALNININLSPKEESDNIQWVDEW